MRALEVLGRPGGGASPGFMFLVGISQSGLGPLLPVFENRSGIGTSSFYLLISGYFGDSLPAMPAQYVVEHLERKVLRSEQTGAAHRETHDRIPQHQK
ncbi:hypothetical protein ACRAKI_12230 [Saccharothrix isguenensis]